MTTPSKDLQGYFLLGDVVEGLSRKSQDKLGARTALAFMIAV